MKNSKLFALARLMLLLLVSVALTLAIVSCGDDEEGAPQGGTAPTTAPTTGSTGGFTGDIACAHTFDNGVVQVAATCTNGGTTIKTCTKCGYESIVPTAKLAHSYTSKVVAATCTENGATVYTCSSCNDSYADVTAVATGHKTEGNTWTAEDVLQSGCNWMHIESTTCSSCNKTVEHISYFEKHDFSVEITTVATCTSEGVKTSTCKVCEATETASYSDTSAHTWDGGVVSPTNASIINYACANDGCSVTKSVFSAKDQVSASVPSDALQSAGAVELQNATVKLDQSTIDQLGGNDVTISADRIGGGDISDILNKMTEAERAKLSSNSVFDFTLKGGDNSISQFNGKVTVTVPYTLEEGADPDNIAVWYIKEDGTLDSIEATYTVINGEGYAVFETNHFSYYSVVRMSVEERCALYGHKYNVEIVPAACNQQGYTLKTCKYCKKVEPRTDFTAALSHDYKSTVVAPSCGVKGYTLNKCALCQDSYNNSYVNELTHNYTKTVVNPTCKSSGYILNSCSLCGDSYKSDETGVVDHSYANGKCTMCGKAQEKAGNAFLTMIDSLANANSYLLESNNFVFTGLVEGVDISYVLNKLKAYVKVTADGYLEGEGTSDVTVTYKEDGDAETMTTTSKVVFKDGKIYLYTDGIDSMLGASHDTSIDHSYPTYSGGPIFSTSNNNSLTVVYPTDVNNNLFAVISQDSLLGMMGSEMGNSSMAGMLGMVGMVGEIFGKLDPVWQDMLGAKNSAIEDMLARMVNRMFERKEVNGGYTYTLNPTFAKVIFNNLKTDTLNVVFDSVFGKGSYASAIEFANRAFDMTIPEIKAEIEGELAKSGLIAATIYSILNEYGIDVEAMVSEYGDMKLYELLNAMTENEEGTADQYREMVSHYDSMFKETTALDLLEAKMGSEYPESDPYGTMIDEVIKYLDKITVSFSTTKDGEFISSSIIFNNLVIDEEFEGEQVKFTANGAFSFSVNTGSASEDNNQLIKDTADLEAAVNPEKNIYTDSFAIITHNGVKYFVRYGNLSVNLGSGSGNIAIKPYSYTTGSSSLVSGSTGGSTITIIGGGNVDVEFKPVVIPGDGSSITIDTLYDMLFGDATGYSVTEILGEETYNGINCTKVTANIANFYILDNNTYTYGSTSCEGWIRVGSVATAYKWYNMNSYYPEATLWLDANSKIVGMEITSDLEEFQATQSEVSFYYAPATKEYKNEPSHNFKIVKDVRPSGCEYGVRTFRCTVCGVEESSTYGTGHTWQQVATLNSGATSCKDGVTITRKCAACGYADNSYSWKTNDHYQVRVQDRYEGSTICGDIYTVYEKCACGTYSNFIGTISDHAFNYDSYYDNVTDYRWSEFKCAVEGCGYSYKYRSCHDYKYEPNNPEFTCWEVSSEEVIINGKTLVFDHERYASHPGNHQYSEDERFTLVTCRLCGINLYEYKYDEHGRTIYEKDYINGYSWERVYTGCDYVQYNSDGTQHNGTNHVTNHYTLSSATCTQYGEAIWKCRLCGYIESHYYYSPYDSYWHDGKYNSHEWISTGNGTYRCVYCDTESTYGSSGMITLEDMTDKGSLSIGYYNGLVLDIEEINIIFNYERDGSGTELENSYEYFTNTDTTPYNYNYNGRTSGIITVDMNKLNQAIADNGNVETVSIVFWMALDSQVEEGETFFQAYALTFTLDELKNLK